MPTRTHMCKSTAKEATSVGACADSGTYLVDGWTSLLLFGGSVQAPERRKPASSLACRPGHGLSASSHSDLTGAGCHLDRGSRRRGGSAPTQAP